MYSEYHKAICEEMIRFSKVPYIIFLGQQVNSENFYNTLNEVPLNLRLELPVMEECQLGLCTGLALEGFLPICIYQRMDFLPRATDQLINHLNLLPEMSRGLFKPKIIIRVTVGTKEPLDVGPQHSQDLTDMYKSILKFPVIKVTTPEEVHEAYGTAGIIDSPIMIVELQNLYNEKC